MHPSLKIVFAEVIGRLFGLSDIDPSRGGVGAIHPQGYGNQDVHRREQPTDILLSVNNPRSTLESCRAPLPTTIMDERTMSFIQSSNYQPLDVIGEGAYGVVW